MNIGQIKHTVVYTSVIQGCQKHSCKNFTHKDVT